MGLNKEDKKKIREIKEFVKEKHKGQFRRGGHPFYKHPFRVYDIVSKYTDDLNLLMASLMHDILEDTDTSREEIVSIANEYTFELVRKLSRGEYKSSKEYMATIKTSKELSLIKLADRYSNIEDLELQEDLGFMKRYIRNTKENYLNILDGTHLQFKLREKIRYYEEHILKFEV